MRIAVTGATGFVGRALVRRLVAEGHEVAALTRDPAGAEGLEGADLVPHDPYDPVGLAAALEGSHGVVNLAGEPIFGRRWTRARKARIRESRVLGTRAIVDAMEALSPRPAAFVAMSAVGYWGPREPDESFDEYTLDAAEHAPRDFLASVCFELEQQAVFAERLGGRVVRLRSGVVLGPGGGALAQMETPFRLGLGGPVAGGRQVLSWIHMDDLVRMILWALETPEVKGALHGTAPHPVTNREFSQALARTLGRPCWLPVPGFALRLRFGQVAGVVTRGQRVLPTKALRLGFRFLYPRVEEALGAIYAPAAVPATPA
jgi:uncharacterized protein (TIGR01777 family)